MRVLALTLLALAASAQDADPRPAWTYDPVEVGNQRAYAQGLTPESTTYWRTDSPTVVTRDGQRWTVRRTQRFFRLDSFDGSAWGREETRTMVRFDTLLANVLVRGEDGTVRPTYPCRLDSPLAPTGGTCGDGQPYTKTADGRLTFQDRGTGFATVLQAGTGVIGGSTDRSPDFELVGAVIDGVTLVEEPEPFPDSRIDPTPAAHYAQMSVGDEWQYEYRGGPSNGGLQYRRVQIVSEADIDGQQYLGFSYVTFRQGEGDWTYTAETTYARFDTLSARVVRPDGSGGATLCSFDEPVVSFDGDGDVYCTTFDSGSEVRGESVASRVQSTVRVGRDSFETPSRAFDYYGIADYECNVGPYYAAGIGNTGYDCFNILYGYNRLIYARVRQPNGTVLELGQPYAVTSDAGPDAGDLALTVGPNPTTGPVTLRLAVPVSGEVRWTVTDALGRVIRQRDTIQASGQTTVSLDLSDAPAGLYVARAATASGAVTATVVRR